MMPDASKPDDSLLHAIAQLLYSTTVSVKKA